MNSFRIGFTSTTFKKKTIAEVVEIAKKAGVRYIEWGENYHVNSLDDAKEAKALCDEAGIGICSYGSYYRAGCGDGKKWEQICKIAAAMGAQSVRIWLGTKNSEDTDEAQRKALLEDTKRMCRVAAEYSLLVCAECHDNTFNNNTDAILSFVKELSADNFKTYFQSRYFRFEYDMDRIDRTYSITENVHVSYSEVTREQRFRKKDKRYLDAILKKYREKNYGGIVMIEFTSRASEKAFIKDVEKLKQY